MRWYKTKLKVVQKQLKGWYKSKGIVVQKQKFRVVQKQNMNTSPLNINLIIPFNSNKGEHGEELKIYEGRLNDFETSLHERAKEVAEDLQDLVGDEFPMMVAKRAYGNSTRYLWRSRGKKDRKYRKFEEAEFQDQVKRLADFQQRAIRAMAKDLVYINENLKVVTVMLDAIKSSRSEVQSIIKTSFNQA